MKHKKPTTKVVKSQSKARPVKANPTSSDSPHFEPFLTMGSFLDAIPDLMGYRPSSATVRSWVRSFGLPATQVPGSPKLLFRLSVFQRWLEEGQADAATPQALIDAAHRRRDLEGC